MTTIAQTPEPVRTKRRWLAPRFSLRMLFLVVTAAAIASAVWWRWPVVETESGELAMLATKADSSEGYEPIEIPTIKRKRFRHGLWGELIRHGTSEVVAADSSQCLLREEWQDDMRHGKFAQYYLRGEPREAGAYRSGKRHGEWTYYLPPGSAPPGSLASVVSHWEDGLATGKWEWRSADGQPQKTAEFRGGVIVAINGQPVTDHLAAQFHQGKLKDARVEEIVRGANSQVFEQPIRRGSAEPTPPLGRAIQLHCEDIGHVWQVPVLFDPLAHYVMSAKTDAIYGIAPPSATLVLVLHDHGLAAVGRYGCLIITTEKVASEPDPTGVENLDIAPDSPLAMALESDFDGVKWDWSSSLSLHSALHQFQKATGKEFDLLARRTGEWLDADEPLQIPRYPRKAYPCDINLREALGLALFQARYRCRLRGDVLVVTPLPLDPWRTGM